MNNAYIYAILVDGVERYIGKGTKGRIKVHQKLANKINLKRKLGIRIKTSKFYNRLAKAIRNGSIIDEQIIIENLNNDDAFAMEILMIASYDKDQLWNEDLGGRGHGIVSEDLAVKLSIARKLFYDNNPEEKEAESERMIKVWKDPEQREKYIRANNIFKNTPEYNKNMGESIKNVWADPIKRDKMIKGMKNSEKTKANNSDPEFLRFRGNAIKNGWKKKQEAWFEEYLANNEISEIDWHE